MMNYINGCAANVEYIYDTAVNNATPTSGTLSKLANDQVKSARKINVTHRNIVIIITQTCSAAIKSNLNFDFVYQTNRPICVAHTIAVNKYNKPYIPNTMRSAAVL